MGVCAFPVYTAQAPGCSIWSGPCVECGSSFRVLHKSERLRQLVALAPSPRARCAISLRGERPRQPEAWVPSPRGATRLFPPRPQRAPPPVGSQEVFRQEPGPVCRVGGGGFSGAEFAPCPSPCLLPPAGVGRLFSGVSQPLCFANRRGVFRPVNFSALPQLKKSLPPTALRAFCKPYLLYPFIY